MYVWKMSTARNVTIVTPTTKFKAHNKYLTRCCLSSDVKLLATASADTTVKIWSTEDDLFSLVMTLEGHQRWVWDCAFSADSAYVVSGNQTITPLSSYVLLSLLEGSDFWGSELRSHCPIMGIKSTQDNPPILRSSQRRRSISPKRYTTSRQLLAAPLYPLYINATI